MVEPALTAITKGRLTACGSLDELELMASELLETAMLDEDTAALLDDWAREELIVGCEELLGIALLDEVVLDSGGVVPPVHAMPESDNKTGALQRDRPIVCDIGFYRL